MNLPNIITLNDCGGDAQLYLDTIYKVFHNDFITSKPVFKGVKLGLKKHPIVDGRECSFYHFTHEGDIETERIPDMRRMERMGYMKVIINSVPHPSLKVWEKMVGTKKRILILHEEERYLVVLEDRGTFILPWTAYYIEYKNRLEKLLKEYNAYMANGGAI